MQSLTHTEQTASCINSELIQVRINLSVSAELFSILLHDLHTSFIT